jgi:hypothetical protein
MWLLASVIGLCLTIAIRIFDKTMAFNIFFRTDNVGFLLIPLYFLQNVFIVDLNLLYEFWHQSHYNAI